MSQRFFSGKRIDGAPPEIHYIHEHIVAYAYKMPPEEVRKMDYYDFMAHLHMCIARMDDEREFDVILAGLPVVNCAYKTAAEIPMPCCPLL